MSNVDLSDACMCIWIRPEDNPRLLFFVVTYSDDMDAFVFSHISLRMGYISIAPYFCYSCETMVNISNASWDACNSAYPYTLKYIVY